MAAGAIIGAFLGVVDRTLGLIGSGQQRRAQESAQRHELVQMALANRMQQNQLRTQIQAQNTQQPNQNTNKNLLVFGGIGIIIIALIGFILWKHSKK